MSEERKPWGFCETPHENCTMNYCDENGCQNRVRHLVEPPYGETPQSHNSEECTLTHFEVPSEVLDFIKSHSQVSGYVGGFKPRRNNSLSWGGEPKPELGLSRCEGDITECVSTQMYLQSLSLHILQQAISDHVNEVMERPICDPEKQLLLRQLRKIRE